MMKVQVKVSPKVFIEGQGDTHTAVFEELASLQEVFGEFHKCRKCGGEALRFVVRMDKDDNKYYEIHCQNRSCRAKLSYGQHKKGGGLYPRRKETDKQNVMGGAVEAGAYLPDNGWIKWNKEKKANE